jgi:hypothetical protein
MRGPEIRQSYQEVIEISGERAIGNACALASKNNSNVGVGELYEGVRAEMGDFLVGCDLNRKKNDPEQFERNLNLLKSFGDGAKTPSQREPRLSSYAKDVVDLAVNFARSKKNPIAQRVNARDLLESIAVVAGQFRKDFWRNFEYTLARKQRQMEEDNAKIIIPRPKKDLISPLNQDQKLIHPFLPIRKQRFSQYKIL